MSKVLRISESVYKKLEANVVGFETPSEVIERAIDSNEVFEVFKLILNAVVSAEEFIKETGERNKTILLHQSVEAIDRAMSLISDTFPQYKIKYSYKQPGLNLKISQLDFIQ